MIREIEEQTKSLISGIQDIIPEEELKLLDQRDFLGFRSAENEIINSNFYVFNEIKILCKLMIWKRI